MINKHDVWGKKGDDASPFFLVTRSVEDSLPFVQGLPSSLCGVVEPMVRREYVSFSLSNMVSSLKEGFVLEGGYIFTSKHAVCSLLRHNISLEGVRTYCVGGATAFACQQAGADVVVSSGGGQDLKKVIMRHHPLDVPLTYCTGNHVSVPLKTLLEEQGYHVNHAVVYKQIYTENLSPSLFFLLRKHLLWGVSFFSRESAHHFYRSLQKTGDLQKFLACVRVFCISQNMAEELKKTYGPHILFWASHAHGDALLQKVCSVYGRSKN